MRSFGERGRSTNVHVNFSGEEGAGGGVYEEDSLEEIEG